MAAGDSGLGQRAHELTGSRAGMPGKESVAAGGSGPGWRAHRVTSRDAGQGERGCWGQQAGVGGLTGACSDAASHPSAAGRRGGERQNCTHKITPRRADCGYSHTSPLGHLKQAVYAASAVTFKRTTVHQQG